MECKVVILDEPTSALDETSKGQIKILIQYMARNKSIIIITHDKSLIENMDRLIVFDKGKVVKDQDLTKFITSQAIQNKMSNSIAEEIEETLTK